MGDQYDEMALRVMEEAEHSDGVVWTVPMVGQRIIAAALRAAVQAERERCAVDLERAWADAGEHDRQVGSTRTRMRGLVMLWRHGDHLLPAPAAPRVEALGEQAQRGEIRIGELRGLGFIIQEELADHYTLSPKAAFVGADVAPWDRSIFRFSITAQVRRGEPPQQTMDDTARAFAEGIAEGQRRVREREAAQAQAQAEAQEENDDRLGDAWVCPGIPGEWITAAINGPILSVVHITSRIVHPLVPGLPHNARWQRVRRGEQ